MTYAGFHKDGYDYLSEGNYILFSADSTHELLFDYAAKDISALPELFRQYIDAKINTSTFTLKKFKKNNEDITKITDLLKSTHPYYEHECDKVIIKAIGEYFNELLIYSVYQKKPALNPDLPLQKEWYHTRFTHLMPSYLRERNIYPDGLYPDDFYNNYRSWIDDKDFDARGIEETFIWVPRVNPTGFSKELETQELVRNMLYFILDSTVNELKDLSVSQRVWFCGNMLFLNGAFTEMHITKYFSYVEPIIYNKKNSTIDDQIKEAISRVNKLLDPAEEVTREYGNIYTLAPEDLSAAIRYAKTIEPLKFYEKYEINSLRELLFQEILILVQDNIKIRKCENCGKYFITKKSNQVYCNRIFGNTTKHCFQLGRSRKYRKKIKNDPVLNAYDSAYQKHYSRVRSNISDTIKNFVKWQAEASAMVQKTKEGKITSEECIEWLQKK